MKTSNKFLLIAGSVPILFIILMLATLKFYPWAEANSQAVLSDTSDLVTRTLPLEGFSEISTNGAWKVNLSQGDSFLVNISAPEPDINNIKAQINGDRLILDDSDTKFKRTARSKSITADITLPTVSGIDMEGVTTVKLGMDIDSVLIRSEGVANISGDKGMIRNLQFIGNGITMLELSAIPVTNADLKCQGIYTIALLMNGGKLSGSIEGLGTFDYDGGVSVNEIIVNNNRNKIIHQTK